LVIFKFQLKTSLRSAEEELLLLEAIDMFGLGNWIDIAEHVGTKNKIQCDYHYWSTYIETPQEVFLNFFKTFTGN
jgi:transcriptional adapter 2-alpha